MSRPALPRAGVGALAVTVLLAASVAAVAAVAADEKNDKVRLCHAEGGPRYVSIEIAPEAALDGHAKNHERDIIPPFEDEKTGSFPGQNWDAEGQAIWGNDCAIPEPEPGPEPEPEYPIGVFGSTTCDDGGTTYTARFGYASENRLEVSIPVGGDNFVAPGPSGRGQPTTFQPGHVDVAFSVVNIPRAVEGSWTVSYGGEPRTANVSAPAGCQKPPQPEPVVDVFVACVDRGNATYTARFGYTNPGTVRVSVPAGPNNGFSPEPEDRGQPILFVPGTANASVTVTGIANGSSLSWTVRTSGGSNTATATSTFPTACTTPPEPPSVLPVSVFVTCVDPGATTYTARFGTNNVNPAAVAIPIGPDNRFDPEPANRGQGTQFGTGEDTDAVTVTGIPNGTSLTWLLNGRTAAASASFPTRCTEDPPEPPQDLPIRISVSCVVNGATTYEARFGYRNENLSTVSIPVGEDNRFLPTPAGRGQPTLFGPGSASQAFAVTGIPNGTNLVWLLSHAGTTHTATASATFATKCSGPEPPRPEPPIPPIPPIQPPDPNPGPSDQPLGLFVNCVQPRGGVYDAVFGYQNDNEASVRIPVGERNGFAPAPVARGQVTEFLPGNVAAAFRVLGIPRGTALTWSVTFAGATVSTTADAAIEERCGEPPEIVEPIGVFACVTSRGSTFDVTFGYLNPNRVAIDLPIGEENRFLPGRFDRGQPSIFLPGRVEDAFTVRGVQDTALLAWYVAFNGRSVIVVGDGHPVRCAGEREDVPLTVFPLCAIRTGNTYTAVFGYQNVNGREVVVPRGEGNRISPSRFDEAQPTRFRPGLVPIAAVIEGIPVSQSVAWVVRSFGASDSTRVTAVLADCRTEVATGRADLSIAKVADPKTAGVGDRIEYTLTVVNEGTVDAASVVVLDRQLEGLVSLVSATASQGRCEIRGRETASERVMCSLGRLKPGDSATVLVAGRARETGTSRNRATVLSLPIDTSTANNTAIVRVPIGRSAVAGAGAGRGRPTYTG